MPDTVGDVISSVYFALLGGRRANNANAVASTINSSVTSFDLSAAHANRVFTGDVIECEDEQMYVTGLSSTNTVTVLRGFNGTAAASHTVGTAVWLNPVLAQLQVRNAVTATVRSLHPSLFRAVSQQFTTVDGQYAYTVTGATDDGTTIGIADAVLGPITGDTRAIVANVKARLVRNDTTNMAVVLSENPGAGRRLRVTFARRFDTSNMADSRELVAGIGLDEGWRDLVELGACWQLMGQLEPARALADRVSTSGDPGTVQHGARSSSAAWFRQRFKDRRVEAVMELRGRYPFVQTG